MLLTSAVLYVFTTLDNFAIKFADYITIDLFYIFSELLAGDFANARMPMQSNFDCTIHQMVPTYFSCFDIIRTNPPISRTKVDDKAISVGGAATIRHVRRSIQFSYL